MNTIIKNKIFAFGAILFVLFGIVACQDLFKDPSKDKETGDKVTLLLLDRNFITTKFNFRLEDTNNQQLSTTEPIQLKFTGAGASNLITFAGKKQTIYSTNSGYVEVGYDPNMPASSTTPIEFTVVASNSSYTSVPIFLSYTTEGTKDVIIKMYSIPKTKSAKIDAFNEPFDISLNGQVQSSNMLFLSDIQSEATGSDWQYRNLYLLLSGGNVTCNNLKDNIKYIDYGVFYSNNQSSLTPPAQASKAANLPSGSLLYSAVKQSSRAKCEKGLKIAIARADGNSGSASFAYQLTFSDNSIKKGRITCSFPSDNYIEQIYYPSSNTAVTVELFGDSQYDVSQAVNLTSACDGTAAFKVTPKSGLKTYKLISRYSCPNSNFGLALTIPGEFRKKGSTENWTSFEFKEGICVLQLTAGQEYEFRVNIDSEYHSYVVPTDPTEVKSFLENSNSSDFRFRNLVIDESSAQVTISCDVEFSQMVCDKIDTGLM
jgi:hypothetical protein